MRGGIGLSGFSKHQAPPVVVSVLSSSNAISISIRQDSVSLFFHHFDIKTRKRNDQN